MTQDEVVALKANLESFGVLLRLVDKDFRHAALVGTVPALVSVPTTNVDGQNFLQIKDKYSGSATVAAGVSGFATALILVATIPEPASPVLFFVAVGLLSLATGTAVTTGILDIQHDSPPAPEKPSSDNTKSDVDSPDGDQDTIEIPNAVAIGDPPNGFDVDKLVTDLGDFALDLTLSDIPVGWDPSSSVGTPGLGDLGGEDGGDGGIDIPIGGIDIPI